MTYGDIYKAYRKEIEERKAEREKKVLDALKNLLSESDYEVSGIKLNFYKYENGAGIEYHFKLPDGFEQDETIKWGWEENIDDVTWHIKGQIDYIAKLRKQYPDYARQNDHIQKHRKYEKVCKLYDTGYPREAYLKAELCGYLKLPNTTSCSVGGGDYELKRTPARVKDFNENIDKLCLFLADCIGELRGMKLKESGD